MATTGTGRRKGTGGVVRAALGAFGEEVAARHLVTKGMAILDRNWRCDIGEIDLVARDRDVLVVCEVKTRRGLGFGTPADAVTWDKLSRLRRLAARWLVEHPVGAVEVRIDVVEVLVLSNDGPRVEHLVGVG
ncbi:MAG: YraN family protein [Nocardioidaceae bacterium]|nr:YraN family protein [Nocardioidaceae bacterium]